MKLAGFYLEHRTPKPDVTSVKSSPLNIKYGNLNEIINYLEKGILVGAYRHIVYSVFTGELIGPPINYTDGEWIWTSELIYYVKNNNIEIPKEFIQHIIDKGFIPPSMEEMDRETLIKISRNYK